jgi:CHASE3 domain sensor protein
MKIASGIFFKFGLPIIIIVGLCFTSYLIFTKPISSLEHVNEKRIEDIKEYEKAVYDAQLSEVENEKLMFYISACPKTIIF